MRWINIRNVLSLVVVLVGVMTAPARAASIDFLSIEGELGPGDAGNYPVDAAFSWISHRFPGSETAHIWTLAPGSDGGMAIGSAQPGRGQITAPRAMYNLSSWLFSVEGGVSYDAQASSFDLANLRLDWGGTVYDFGFGGDVTSLVPLVSGADAVASSNGWWRDAAGAYHLVFRGDGQCDGCELTVHLTGQISEVPLPGASWLLGSGLMLLMRYARERGAC